MRFKVIASACVVVLLGGGWALAQTDLSNGVFIAHAPASLQCWRWSRSAHLWWRYALFSSRELSRYAPSC